MKKRAGLGTVILAIENLLLTAMVLAALALISWDIVIRYFFPSKLADWTTEVIIYLVVSAMLLSGWSLVRANMHVRAELIVERFRPGVRHWIEVIIVSIGVLYCSAVAWYGKAMVQFAASLGINSASSLHFPVWVFYLSVPVSFALMASAYLIRLLNLLHMTHQGRHRSPRASAPSKDDAAKLRG
ncbi:hypothetical protein B7H23_04440 [Notoacmeibacter marinus]|uniref:TRAP transporter small permease protein n=1 Tax=Notoacmeibacter marinus TaxID=1876515 RepID=A0A231V1U8_9HYPH|nr:TRAP transporter small permease [Notoacmeibacter marinus]OXT02175.1 hypothetical protein B7H23_04440 [Notoacmeibacter marinus]